MSKIHKALHALSLIIKQPSLLNHVINAEEVMKDKVAGKYGLPSPGGLKTIDLLDLFPDFKESVSPFSGMEGSSSPLDLALLRGLAKSFKACSYLEIGTWRGESVANVSAVANDCTTINLPDDEMLQMGLPENYVRQHRLFSDTLKNVTHIQQNTTTFDFKTLHKKFDLIFVDGDHHFDMVKNDTQKVFELLRDKNSVIVWHDYASNPGEVRFEVLAGILAGCPPELKDNLFYVSNTLCAIFTRCNYRAAHIALHSRPNKVFSLEIKAEKLSR